MWKLLLYLLFILALGVAMGYISTLHRTLPIVVLMVTIIGLGVSWLERKMIDDSSTTPKKEKNKMIMQLFYSDITFVLGVIGGLILGFLTRDTSKQLVKDGF